MWTVIYVAPSKEAADQLQEALAKEGLLVRLRATGLSTYGGSSHIELLAPRAEAREAQALLNQTLVRMQKRK